MVNPRIFFGPADSVSKTIKFDILGNTDDFFTNATLYPNPATDKLKILGSSSHDFEYRLVSADYKNFVLKRCESDKINLSDLPDGVYVLEVRYRDQVTRKKFIKQQTN